MEKQMPTMTFFNLPEEKRTRLIQGAMDEFVKVPVNKASVSNIILNAGISRGSFYQYFDDINDLYFYLIGLFYQNTHKLMMKSLKEKNGHFMDAVSLFGSRYIRSIMKDKKVGFYKNLYLNMNYKIHRKMNLFMENVDTDSFKETRNELFSQIDFDSLRVKSQKEISSLLDFCMDIVNQTIIEGFYQEWTIAETQSNFRMRLDWIAYGVVLNECPSKQEKNKKGMVTE